MENQEDNINSQVLDTFCQVSSKFVGNVNSLHSLGLESKKLEIAATEQIKKIFNINNFDIIYTGGRDEANNLAILGIIKKFYHKNKKIIVFDTCHSSIYEVLNSIKDQVEIVRVQDYEEFVNNYDETVIMICFSDYDIGKLLLKNSFDNCYLFYDANNIGEDVSGFDFVSFDLEGLSPLVGIGFLAKKNNIVIEPIIHGGKSSTIYRSGTPALALIVAFSKNIRLLNNLK